YLTYTLFITAISLIMLFSFVSLIALGDNYTFYKEALNWISILTGLLIIFLLPLLLLVFPAMIFMKTNLFKALKGVISLSKQYYSREFSIILIGLILCLFSWGIINNYTYTESLFTFGSYIQTGFSAIYIFGIIFLLIMTSILYSIITSLISQCFLNVWACKLGLENIYAIKILSASLNGKKIPKSWYKNRPVDKLQEKDKTKKQNRQTKSKNNKKTTSSISGQSREKFRKKNKSETS
ncbi:MAG: hypothetical protein ACOCV8_01500, partial [Spirochaetota bacterium]